MHRVFVLFLAAALTACVHAVAATPAPRLIVKQSPHSVGETIDRLEAAVVERGATVFARVDHAEGAASINQPLAPMQVLVFGNPALGTPILQQSSEAGIDLPARVLAWRDGDAVNVAYVSGTELARRHGLVEDDPNVARFSGALDALTDIAIASD